MELRLISCNCLKENCQFARSGQISEFHIFALPNAAPYTVPPGRMPPFAPPLPLPLLIAEAYI